jgi:pyridoxamine 5'-phosphate oxidase
MKSRRKNATLQFLDIKSINTDPISQFKIWFDEVISSGVQEPAAMTLATSTRKGIPSARIVLMKKFDEKGFVFFTNYKSNKAKQLELNPNGALVFHWKELNRQVRINGKIKKITGKESDDYFAIRPLLSNVSAVVSPQSKIIPSRDFLENLFNEFYLKSDNKKVERPLYWGGYRLSPSRIEFWQGRENRLHDRIVYVKRKSGWQIYRLAP